ncbi:MAG: glycosyltransferase family 4 protein [Methylococcales bacterium]|nr:glycosyltransferase [Methylococcaceae bacterium]
MKVLTLNFSDSKGGAARAAYRIHQALRRHGIDSSMRVNQATTGDWTVQGPRSKWDKAMARLRPSLDILPNSLINTGISGFQSIALLASSWPERINNSDADIAHLHWINAEMMSIGDIGRIRKPIVWTLHDMWAFCGSTHYSDTSRWKEGYTSGNLPAGEAGYDLDRWVWQRKFKAWQRAIQIVTPSRWLAECVQQSALMRDWPVSVIPNAIDTDIWKPIDKRLARSLLGLPVDVPLLLFGAIDGEQDPRKGFDLLRAALDHLRGQIDGLQLAIFGQHAPRNPEDLGFPVHYTGPLHDDLCLQVLYNAADLLVIPSRQDNLPNTGVEALACGTPVLAFDVCGLPDIVQHQQTGYLAKAFDTEQLASGIQWILEDTKRHSTLSTNARADAVARFSYPAIAQEYLKIYNDTI